MITSDKSVRASTVRVHDSSIDLELVHRVLMTHHHTNYKVVIGVGEPRGPKSTLSLDQKDFNEYVDLLCILRDTAEDALVKS